MTDRAYHNTFAAANAGAVPFCAFSDNRMVNTASFADAGIAVSAILMLCLLRLPGLFLLSGLLLWATIPYRQRNLARAER